MVKKAFNEKVTVRYLQKGDLNALEFFLRPMWLSHAKNEDEFIEADVLANISLSKYFEKALKRKGEFVLVAEKDGEIVGILKVDEVELENFFKNKKAYYLDDLAVKEEHQRQGIASQLIEKAINIAKKNGIEVIKTRIYTFNKVAQRLFEKHGLEPLYSEYFRRVTN